MLCNRIQTSQEKSGLLVSFEPPVSNCTHESLIGKAEPARLQPHANTLIKSTFVSQHRAHVLLE